MEASPIPLAWGSGDGGRQHAAREALYASGPGHDPLGEHPAPHEAAGRVLWPLGLKEQALQYASAADGGLAPFRASPDRAADGPPAAQHFFIAPAFSGSQPGYVFKMGPQGLGYYADVMQPQTPAAAPPPSTRQPLHGLQLLAPLEKQLTRQPLVAQAVEQQQLTRQPLVIPPEPDVPPVRQAVSRLKELLYRLPKSVDAMTDSKNVLRVLREMQIQSERGCLAAGGGPDEEDKVALVGAIKWALQQEQQLHTVLEDLVFACLVVVNMGLPSGTLQTSSNIVFIPMLIDTIKAGPVQAKTHCAIVLSQIVLEGTRAVEAIVHYPEFLHHCTMLVCSSSDDAKSEAALLVNNLAALAEEDVQSRLAGHGALVGALKSIVQYGGPVQQCRSAGAFMHLSKAVLPRGHLRSSRVNEALENTIRARLVDKNPTSDQRATLGLATMAHINLMVGNAELLPPFQDSDSHNEVTLVQLLVELLISSVQQRALFGINWRLKDVLWSMRVLAGNSLYFTLLVNSGLVEVLGMIQESKHTSVHGQDPDLIKRLVQDIHACLVQNRVVLEQEEQGNQQAKKGQRPAALQAVMNSNLPGASGNGASMESSLPTSSSSTDGIGLLLRSEQSAESITSLSSSKTIQKQTTSAQSDITDGIGRLLRSGQLAESISLSSSKTTQKQTTSAQSGTCFSLGTRIVRDSTLSPPSQVHERVFLRCVKRIQGLQMLQAFNTWVCNMRSDRAFLDSKLYTKLVNQLAKERVRNVDLERSLQELQQSIQSAPPAADAHATVKLNARVKKLEEELATKQERISKLENVHRDSVEQLVRERVSVHLGALAERAQGDTEEVQQLQVQLREQNGQLEAASQQIAELEAQIANVRLSRNAHSVGQKSPSPKKNVHRNPNASPSVSCNDSQEPHSEEVTMQMATAEVNSSVAKLVDVLHTELRERAASHSAIMTAIANTVAMRCSSVPPSDELHDGGKYLQKIQPIPVISRSPPASFVVQQDTDASDKSTSSQRTSSASRNNSQSPDIPSAQPDMEYQTWSFGMPQSMSDSRRDRTTRPPSSGRAENLTCHRNQTESDMEIRHASILALSAKLRVG